MQRIDTATAAANLFGAGKPGFTDGDPTNGVSPTYLDAAMFNALQEEICGVIEETGAALNPAIYNQLLTAIQALITAAEGGSGSFALNGYWKFPGGLIVQWGKANPPTANTSAQVFYPITFPTSVYGVAMSSGSTSPGAGAGYTEITTSFLEVWSSVASGGITYIVIGN